MSGDYGYLVYGVPLCFSVNICNRINLSKCERTIC